jgi:hypothetical protein
MALKAEAWSSSSLMRLRGSGHPVEIEIGDARRLSGDRLYRQRKPSAEQDSDDDRSGHGGKPKHGRSDDTLDLAADLAAPEVCADRPGLLAIARDLAGDRDVGIVVPPVVSSVADADFRKLDVAGASGVELVLHLAGGIGGQHRIAERGKRRQRRKPALACVKTGQALVRNDAVGAIQDEGMRAEPRGELACDLGQLLQFHRCDRPALRRAAAARERHRHIGEETMLVGHERAPQQPVELTPLLQRGQYLRRFLGLGRQILDLAVGGACNAPADHVRRADQHGGRLARA